MNKTRSKKNDKSLKLESNELDTKPNLNEIYPEFETVQLQTPACLLSLFKQCNLQLKLHYLELFCKVSIISKTIDKRKLFQI